MGTCVRCRIWQARGGEGAGAGAVVRSTTRSSKRGDNWYARWMPIVAAAGTWQKWLIKAGLEVGGAVAAYLLDKLTEGSSENDVGDVLWTRWTFEYSRSTPTGTVEDRAQFSIDVVNLTSGAIDTTWTATDLTDVWGAFAPVPSALRPYQQPSHSLVRVSAHLMGFSPETWPAKRFLDTGPPVWAADIAPVAGSGTTGAYQVAATVTERTAFPGHWGRLYVPGLAGGALDANGRITSTARNAILAAFETAADALRAKDFYVVVPMTQHDKAPAFGLLSLTQLSVDDIPDVQRRRRPKQVAARSLST